jgi:erythromycin esterase
MTTPLRMRSQRRDEDLVDRLGMLARPLSELSDLDPLLERIGDARYVLLGEASHGTSDYYRWRAALTLRLIREKGFSFVAVEGDWPDCRRVDRFVKDDAHPEIGPQAVLQTFGRWPTWMWANLEVAAFMSQLQVHNAALPTGERVGFYGLDVYSLWDSLERVSAYLKERDPQRRESLERVLRCFEPYGDDVEKYALATRWIDESCEDEVVALLGEVRGAMSMLHEERWASERDAHFDAEQNALVVKSAERYYRTMVRGGAESWNVRDRHMTQTLERLMEHHGPHAKAVVWEHNTHIGDARFTDMAASGVLNVGQLIRERHDAADVVLVGFGSFEGTVIAARAWEAPMERMRVPPAVAGSWEELFHRLGARNHWLLSTPSTSTDDFLEPRGQRAIGVVYHPDSERANYVPTVLPRRYDAFLYFDASEALHPVGESRPQEDRDLPETFPSGL